VSRTPEYDKLQKMFGTGEAQFKKMADTFHRDPTELWDKGVLDFPGFRIAVTGRAGRSSRNIYEALMRSAIAAMVARDKLREPSTKA